MSKSEINFIPGYVNIEVEEGTLGEEDGALQTELDPDTYKPYHDKPISWEEWVSEYKMKQETQLEFEQKHVTNNVIIQNSPVLEKITFIFAFLDFCIFFFKTE